MPRIEPPDYKERIMLMGTNGSGKSECAKQLIAAGYPRTVSVDLKGDFDPPIDYTVIKTPNDFRWGFKGNGHIVYRPKREHLNKRDLEIVNWRIYDRMRREGKRKPFIYYVDEVLLMSELNAISGLIAMAVAGRSLRGGLWYSSQRPYRIPVALRSEAWRWYVFYLQYEEDRKEVIRYTGGKLQMEDLTEGLGDFSFIEVRRADGGKQHITKFPPMSIQV